MKKSTIITLVILAILLLSSIGLYNSMVTKDEEVANAWAQVENQYQRRSDLIPNLVNTVKGYAEHERSTLDQVVEARSKASQITVDPANLTPETLAAFQQAQGELGAALNRLLMIRESYPDLKANQNFIELQAQLEGTENRIAVARRDFNEITRDYNSYIRKFPNNIFAGIFGFDRKVYFQSAENADKAPEVKF